MPTHFIAALISAVMLAMSAGCRSGDASASTSQVLPEPADLRARDQSGDHRVRTTGGSYEVSINPPPSRLPLNELFALNIGVVDAATKRPVADISVRADAAMPQHRHGMNTAPRTTRNADGSFTARGMMLHMPGYWEIYVDVTRNGQTERAVIEVELD